MMVPRDDPPPSHPTLIPSTSSVYSTTGTGGIGGGGGGSYSNQTTPVMSHTRPLLNTDTNLFSPTSSNTSASSTPSHLSPGVGLRADREIKNLIHFRIPHEVTPNSSKQQQSAVRPTSPLDANNGHHSANSTPATSARPIGSHTPSPHQPSPQQQQQQQSTWAAAIAASVSHQPTSDSKKTKSKIDHGETTHPPVTDEFPPTSSAPISRTNSPPGTLAIQLEAAAVNNSNSSNASPLPNAWHRSDKPLWSASTATAPISKESKSSSKSTASSTSSKSAKKETLSTSAKKLPSSTSNGTSSTTGSRSSSRSKPSTTVATTSTSSSSKSTTGTSAVKKSSTKTSSGSATKSSKAESVAPVHETSDHSSTPVAVEVQSDAASSSHLPTVVESNLSRTNSGDVQPTIVPVLPTPSSTTESNQPEPIDDSLAPSTASPSLIPETPPDSDLLAPLPQMPSMVPAMSLTRRTSGVSNMGVSSVVKPTKTSGSAELTKRLWSHLLDNLSRTTNELFYLCHMHMSTTQGARCRQVLYHLQSTTKDFTKLLEHAEQKTIKKKVSSTTTSLSASKEPTTSTSSSTLTSSTTSSSSSSSLSKPLSRSRKSLTTSSSSSSTSSSSTNILKLSSTSSSSTSSKYGLPPVSPRHARATSKSSGTTKSEEDHTMSVSSSKKSKSSSIKDKETTTKEKEVAKTKPRSSSIPSPPESEPLTTPPLPPPSTSGPKDIFGLLGLTNVTTTVGIGRLSLTQSKIPVGPSQGSSSSASPHTPPHSRQARAGSTPTATSHLPSPSRIRPPTDLHLANANGAIVSIPSASIIPIDPTEDDNKWNLTSDLLGSGDPTTQIAPNSESASSAQISSTSSSTHSSSKPPLPKSAWTSQSQTQQMLSSHKTNGVAKPTSNKTSTLSTKSPAFKPMQLVLPNSNSLNNQAIELPPSASTSSTTLPPEPVTPPRRLNADDNHLLSPASTDPANLSPLQKRLISPERLQLRHRAFASLPTPLTANSSPPVSASDLLSRPSSADGHPTSSDGAVTGTNPLLARLAAHPDRDTLLAAHLQQLSQTKQEKAARNREEALAAKRKQGELVTTRLSSAEMRREIRVRTKDEQTSTRIATALENAEEALEMKRKRAENENQKVNELKFINEQAMEERKYAAAMKAETSEARVKALAAQRIEKVAASNSRTTAVVDEKRRAERESMVKKTAEHEKIDARLALAEARRIQGKTTKLTKSSSGLQLSHSTTPNESPFTSPRVSTTTLQPSLTIEQAPVLMMDETIPATAIATIPTPAPTPSESTSELDLTLFCTLCKVKLKSESFVQRHILGKKHQALVAEQNQVGQTIPNDPSTSTIHILDSTVSATTTSSNSNTIPPPAPLSCIVPLASLPSETLADLSHPTPSTSTTLVPPLLPDTTDGLPAKSKSARRNQKRKQRKIRHQELMRIFTVTLDPAEEQTNEQQMQTNNNENK